MLGADLQKMRERDPPDGDWEAPTDLPSPQLSYAGVGRVNSEVRERGPTRHCH